MPSMIETRPSDKVLMCASIVVRGPQAQLTPSGLVANGTQNRRMAYDLERFVEAQDDVYGDVVAELRRGRKTSHWMWFVFPQIAGLGRSWTSQRYAIRTLDEARAYLAHPVLGVRLRECARLVLGTQERTAEQIFGSIDALKLRSSMTLFDRAAPDEPLFADVLGRFYGGVPDPATDRLLAFEGDRPDD